MKINSLHWNDAAYICKQKLWQKLTWWVSNVVIMIILKEGDSLTRQMSHLFSSALFASSLSRFFGAPKGSILLLPTPILSDAINDHVLFEVIIIRKAFYFMLIKTDDYIYIYFNTFSTHCFLPFFRHIIGLTFCISSCILCFLFVCLPTIYEARWGWFEVCSLTK